MACQLADYRYPEELIGHPAEHLQKELDERWLPYVQREIAKVEPAQALIDTPEEYDRVANACDGEIRKRLSKNLPQTKP